MWRGKCNFFRCISKKIVEKCITFLAKYKLEVFFEKIMGTLQQNLAIGREALTYTINHLSFGRGNSWSDNINLLHPALPFMCVMAMRTTSSANSIAQIATEAEENHCGNCGEHASVAMMYLHRQGIRPLDFMTLTNGDHDFVIIDRANNSNGGQPSTWGTTAVVCDTWSRVVYPATELVNRMREMCRGQNPIPRSVYRDVQG